MTRPQIRIDRALLAAKAFYFMFYAAAASLSPYMSLYYREAGLPGSQIGVLLGLAPLITLFASPLWGGLADATHRHQRVLIASIAGVLASVWGISAAHGFAGLLPAVASFALFASPIMAIVDHAVLQILGPRRGLYPRQRLWGAVGWGAMSALMGVVTGRYGLRWAFVGYMPLMAGCLLVAWRMPFQSGTRGVPFWRGLRLLTGNRQWLVFLGTVFLASVGGSTAFNFLFLHLEDLGAPRSLMGLALAVASVGEVIMFLAAGRLLARWGAQGLLLISLGATLLRLTGYALLRRPEVVLPIQLLHGPAFSGLLTAGVSYSDEMAPPGLGATAQALFGAVNFGLASTVGSLIGGAIYERSGSSVLFAWAAGAVVVAIVFYVAAQRVLRSRGPSARGERATS